MKKLLVLAFIISSVIASTILSIAMDHNTMEVFCKEIDTSECSFDYSYATFIWLIWFVPSLVLQIPTYWFVLFVIKRFSANKLKP